MTAPIFSVNKMDLRTDEDFRSRRQWERHVGDSSFESLRVDTIGCFPLDYMHIVCLGVMKRLITVAVRSCLKTDTFILNSLEGGERKALPVHSD